MVELVIRGGTVVDGTGAPTRTADVVVAGGRIVEVGRLAGFTARRTIDAGTSLLTHGVRDRTCGPRLPLELAVHRLTADPARLDGLGDRGAVAPGLRADLDLLDPDALRLLPPEQVADLPAGATRLVQRSEGDVETLVAGETVVVAGERTDARPGALVRGAR